MAAASLLLTERRAVENSLYNHLRLLLLPGLRGQSSGPAGVASGDAALAASGWSVWSDGAFSFTGTNRVGYQDAAFNALGLVGLEYAPTDRWLFGLAMGYSNMTTTYYNGSGANQYDSGFVLNPYIGFTPVDNLLLAVQGGLTLSNTTVTGHQTVFGAPISYEATYGAVTGAISTDAVYAIVLDRLVITPHAGYSYSSRQPQSGHARGVELGLLNAGAMVGYNFEPVTPFISAAYSYDTIGQTKLQREDMLGTAGLTWRATDRFQTTVSVSNAFFRDKEYETSFNLNLRYTF